MTETRINEKTGLPIMDKPEAGTVIPMIVAFGLGYGIAFAIYAFGDTTKYQGRIDTAKEYDVQWLMLALAIF